MSDVADRLRLLVVNRAGNRCEYCLLSQDGQEASFHSDHIKEKEKSQEEKSGRKKPGT